MDNVDIKLKNFENEIHLPELETSNFKDRLPPDARARYTLAFWVLSIATIFMLFAWCIKVYYPLGVLDFECPPNNLSFCNAQIEKAFNYSVIAAEGIYDLAKTWIPPIIALVLGFYFGRGESTSDNSN